MVSVCCTHSQQPDDDFLRGFGDGVPVRLVEAVLPLEDLVLQLAVLLGLRPLLVRRERRVPTARAGCVWEYASECVYYAVAAKTLRCTD